jgi:hypothetical protein
MADTGEAIGRNSTTISVLEAAPWGWTRTGRDQLNGNSGGTLREVTRSGP